MAIRRDDIPFPCDRLPDNPAAARLIGLYPQAQPGRWMQRVKVLGGRLSADQWRVLGEVAAAHSPGTPLHLTTRQDVELHDLTPESVPAVQRAVAAAGLSCVGACGDTLRNITVCPCSGIAGERVDLTGLARTVRETLEAETGIYGLPRKFKISFSACTAACGQPWINDLGFVIAGSEGRRGFRVIGAGSLGPRPATGITLFDWLEAADVLPCALAAVKVFALFGDRANRRRARLRHVRERLGEEVFLRALHEVFATVKADPTWPAVELTQLPEAFPARALLTFPNGDVTPEAAAALAGLAGGDDVRVRIANQHRVACFGRDEAVLSQALASHPPLAGHARPQPNVVACPGSRWCSRALTDTNRLAGRIRSELAGTLPPETTVCISGCPNGCAHHAVADVGLHGVLATGDAGRKREAFNLFLGGGMGRSDRLAAPAGTRLSPDEVLARLGGAAV